MLLPLLVLAFLACWVILCALAVALCRVAGRSEREVLLVLITGGRVRTGRFQRRC